MKQMNMYTLYQSKIFLKAKYLYDVENEKIPNIKII